VKPPFAYFGGKTTLGPRIAGLLPSHDHYVEPFAGSLAVLLAKQPTTWETVNDLDDLIVNFWRVLRDRPEELARAALLTPHSRSEYATSCEDIAALDDVERARLTWVRITQGRKNTTRPGAASHWRYKQKAVGDTSWPDRLNAFVKRMERVALRLKNVSLENRDAIEVVTEYGRHPGTCLYVDPPYIASSRVAQSQYRHEAADDDFHIRLAEALNACTGSVILSGYHSPIYDELYPTWNRLEMRAPVSLGASERVEVLWSNRPLGEPDLFSTLDGLGA
jgi:DNA adenine methylase